MRNGCGGAAAAGRGPVLTGRSRFCSKACLLAKSISLSNCIYIHSTEHTSHAKPCPVHSTKTGPRLAFCSLHSEPLSLVSSESGGRFPRCQAKKKSKYVFFQDDTGGGLLKICVCLKSLGKAKEEEKKREEAKKIFVRVS